MTENSQGLSSGPMLSFPSTFNSGGDGLVLQSNDTKQISAFNKEIGKTVSDFSSAIQNIKTKNLSIRDVRRVYYSENAMNISQYSSMLPVTLLGDPNQGKEKKVMYEDPYHFPSQLLREMNLYRFMYKKSTSEILGMNKENGQDTFYTIQTAVAPSLFNPKYNVQVIGMTHNVPLLLDQTKRGEYAIDDDVTDCSVKKLIELSLKEQLGQQKYRLADFIFCKDYGKVSNNHMITLRKFSLPVGDIIGAPAAPKYSASQTGDIVSVDNTDDVAHLVGYFGTDDNKLEDIIKYSYQYTWKLVESELQRLPSQENDPERGIIGMFKNMNPSFSIEVNKGTGAGGATFLGIFGGAKTDSWNQPASGEVERVRFIDNNVVYEPKQTMRDVNIPEGKLIFTNEFSLTFSYKLRAYENINPKSAFLDLLANIHECTYFRGKYWAGRHQVQGPGPNDAAYKNAYHFIDGAVDKIGGALKTLIDGNFNKEEILGAMSSIVPQKISDLYNEITEGVKNNGIIETAKTALQKTASVLADAGLGDVIKGQLKNALGRPAFYAFHTMITNSQTGLWHVTIGNPRNPIVSMGNMIMTNAQVQHMGPLGLDDFPTELKVTCTLKPATSRDLTGIQKMYTQGVSGIYFTKQYDKLSSQLAVQSANPENKLINKTQDQSGNDVMDIAAIEAQQKLINDGQNNVEQDYSKMGLVSNDLGMLVTQTGTSNLFKLQISQDQEAGFTI